ncbi:hypothetical protein F444_07741 [Phytophthora nicotianae P1976]|uniref:Uncharacterized protein n=1 Tax=Phytophthora nicotianae P1976 TaxID=1317066 RepID=A0A081ADQ5_PHYNI|nr:hypothetical protein F444_07741 [Phytophthora nicotianae P1976]
MTFPQLQEARIQRQARQELVAELSTAAQANGLYCWQTWRVANLDQTQCTKLTADIRTLLDKGFSQAEVSKIINKPTRSITHVVAPWDNPELTEKTTKTTVEILADLQAEEKGKKITTIKSPTNTTDTSSRNVSASSSVTAVTRKRWFLLERLPVERIALVESTMRELKEDPHKEKKRVAALEVQVGKQQNEIKAKKLLFLYR